MGRLTNVSNYRNVLPFGLIFGIAAVVSTVYFLYYTDRWYKDGGQANTPAGTAELNFTRASYGYYGAVLSLLMLIVFFHGYHMTMVA